MATLPDWCFRQLTPEEMAQFREYARTHDPDPEKWSIYHPVCRAEWVALKKAPRGVATVRLTKEGA